jgi:TonB family protein
MFNNLIESDVHTADLKRKGSFLFGTMLIYALLLLAAGVGSIYAYEAQVDSQSLELTTLVTMLPPMAAPPKSMPDYAANHQPRATSISDSSAQVPMRTQNQSDVTDMRNVPTNVAVTGNNVPPMPRGAMIGDRNVDLGGSLPFGNDVGPVGPPSARDNSGGNDSFRDTPPEMPKTEVKLRPTRPKTLGVIESKVTYKAVPPYPPLAKQVRASGPVPVEVVLDEQGRVISAHATGGHPLLQAAAVKAAYQTRFSPTYLSNQPVKVSGIITFNFVLQ